MSLTKQFPIACNVFENFAKLQKFRARIWKKCRTAKKLLFTASPSGSCQLWFKRFRAHMACTRHFFNSCATFLKTSKVANFPTQVWELFLCVQTSRVENFRAQVFCEMTRMKHFPLACNFVQTLQSANFRARFCDFFFCLRSVAHEIFSARVQLFANFSKFRFSCTILERFVFMCNMSRTTTLFSSRAKKFLFNVEPLRELSPSVNIRFRYVRAHFGTLFRFAKKTCCVQIHFVSSRATVWKISKVPNFVHEFARNMSRTPCWSNKVSKHAREILEPKFGNSPRGSTTKNVFVARERKMFRARHDFQRNVEISCTKFFGTIIGKLCN